MKKVRLVYVGIGGYGVTNLDRYLSNDLTDCELAGVVDVDPTKSFFYERLKNDNVKFYSSIEEFFDKDHADLAILSTPIPFHASQSIYCMQHGCNVLCEKPVASTVEEALQMKKVSEETGKFVNIGYQASYSKATLALKADVAAGVFGKPISAKTLVLWPRSEKYYGRSSWAGKLKGQGGNWILDSVANNATAHYLHNMFYVLGGEDNHSLEPTSLEFELYRGNDIETFDTCALRANVNDIPLLFLVSHTVDQHWGPQIEFKFEKATIVVPGGDERDFIYAHFSDGTCKGYGSMQDGAAAKIQHSIDMVLGKKKAVCAVEAALPQALVIREFHKDPAFIQPMDTTTKIYEDGGVLHYHPGLYDDLHQCFRVGKLPSEIGFDWAKPSNKSNM